MNCDALMRWEWEGGTPASGDRRDEVVRTNPAEPTQVQSQPMTGVSRRMERRLSDPRSRKVGRAMAASADRQLLSRLLLVLASLAAVLCRSRAGDGAGARAAAIGVGRLRGSLADRLRSRSQLRHSLCHACVSLRPCRPLPTTARNDCSS